MGPVVLEQSPCRVVVRTSHTTLHGAMVKILDKWLNVTDQHQFWIQILLIFNAYVFVSKENTIPQWNYGQIKVD